MENAIQIVLMCFVLPLWVAAGFADWLCHRRTNIVETAGTKESALHLVMFSQMGLAIGIATFFAVTSTTFLLMGALLISHQLTAYWDLHYAGGKRTITPLEQQIHSLLETMPLFAFVLIALANWGTFLNLLGIGAGTRIWSLTLIAPALPAWYLAGLAGCVVMFSVVPYWYELFACIRYARHRAQQLETPDLQRTTSR